ncbi:MAG: hypothetical protein MZU95_16885 [Desulfomicrobium escambiense]|nr:hypothetical protein [Desulfomicrobium escambiense]
MREAPIWSTTKRRSQAGSESCSTRKRGVPAMAIVGKSPQAIAKLAGFEIPEDAKLLLVPLTTIGPEDWFSHEKLSPVLGYITFNSTDEAIQAAKSQLLWGGAGHTAVVHAQDDDSSEQVRHGNPRQQAAPQSAGGTRQRRPHLQPAASFTDPRLRYGRRQLPGQQHQLQRPSEHQDCRQAYR